MAQWPLQSRCNIYYGNPALANFEAANIVKINTPWKSLYLGKPVSAMRVHRKCASTFQEWFETVWRNAERKQWVIDAWGMSDYYGAFLIRPKRGGSTLSMHSYGCAIDFDADRNGYKDNTPNFAKPELHDAIVKPFKALGGVWGGDWKTSCDGMHFQLAVVG